MKESLIIEPKSDTPGVIIDPEKNEFEIYGKSLPEDTNEFYDPVLDFLEKYSLNPNPHTKFVLNFEYYNSASVRKIMNILTFLEDIKSKGYDVSIVWMYEENDEIMKESGIDFQETVEVPFEIKSFKFDY